MRNFLIDLTDTLSLILAGVGLLTPACWFDALHLRLLWPAKGGRRHA